MNGDALASSTTTKRTIFPLLHEKVATANSDTTNPPSPGGIRSKWAFKEPKLIKDAFPPRKTFCNPQLHGKEVFTTKNFNHRSQRETTAKNYTCPNIIDMNNVIFCSNYVQKNDRQRRRIDGFSPNKIRSSTVKGATIRHYHRTPMQVNISKTLALIRKRYGMVETFTTSI